jgi:hypothetical protein
MSILDANMQMLIDRDVRLEPLQGRSSSFVSPGMRCLARTKDSED